LLWRSLNRTVSCLSEDWLVVRSWSLSITFFAGFFHHGPVTGCEPSAELPPSMIAECGRPPALRVNEMAAFSLARRRLVRSGDWGVASWAGRLRSAGTRDLRLRLPRTLGCAR
jgi:hypothetical protein